MRDINSPHGIAHPGAVIRAREVLTAAGRCMILASFNANSIRARLPILQRWIGENSPDVLCVQETKVRDEDFPLEPFESAGYHVLFKGEKSYNGVAILSRLPLEMPHAGFDGEGRDEGSRLLAARVGDIHVVNTYVPQGLDPSSEKFRYKLEWFARLREFFAARFEPGQALLWAGDFNVAPEPEDVYDPEGLLGRIGFHPEEHRALASVREWGFVDVFRMFDKKPGRYTFWDYRERDAVARGRGWRVDHLWATAPLAARARRSWIDIAPRLWDRPSDHTFIAAEFD